MVVGLGPRRIAQHLCAACEHFEQRPELGQATALGVADRHLQPRVDLQGSRGRHGCLLTEMARPSRSGTMEVSRSGCVVMRLLYSAIASVSAAGFFGLLTNPGTTSPLHSTLSVTRRPPGRSSATRRSSILT